MDFSLEKAYCGPPPVNVSAFFCRKSPSVHFALLSDWGKFFTEMEYRSCIFRIFLLCYSESESFFLFSDRRLLPALLFFSFQPHGSARHWRFCRNRLFPVPVFHQSSALFLRSDLWSGSSFCFQQIFIPPLNLHLFTFCNRLPDSSRTMNTKFRLLPFKIGRFFWQKRREDAFSFMDAAIFIQLFQVYFQANSSPFQGFSAGQKSVCF